jgi:aconitate hydratase
MSVADRATIANMAPEYGATVGFFPIDEQTLAYLRLTGRDENLIDLVERYAKEQGLWRQANSQPTFTETLELDLGTVTPSLAGPLRPQDRVDVRSVKQAFRSAMVDVFKKQIGESVTPRLDRWNSEAPMHAGGADRAATVTQYLHNEMNKDAATVTLDHDQMRLTHGDVVIAAITSCTNTSNPSVMVAAGLVAKKAVALGMKVPHYVKTSLAPGSRVVTDYLDAAGLSEPLDAIGFQTVGYGCTTCIGNSGPLPKPVSAAIEENDLVVAAVLSGNRNFEGRVHPNVKANFLASPPLVVAYALAGTVDVNLMQEPIGKASDGHDVYLKDIWPTQQEVNQTVEKCLKPAMFTRRYGHVADGNPQWNDIPVKGGQLFNFDPHSTYIQEPPFFTDLSTNVNPIAPIKGARVLVMVGGSVTTDHISPAGDIKKDGPAAKYLLEHGVAVTDFNSFGARRGNDRVMTRGTFANIRLKNLLAPGTEGGVTRHLPNGNIMSIYDASMLYQADKVPLIVLAGKDYGMGSSRDWAAKGAYLLGVKAVIAESFERIHRSNLVGMGVLPLVYKPGQTRTTLGLTGEEIFDIQIDDKLTPKQDITVRAGDKTFVTTCRIDTPVEIDYYRNGGILHTVLRNMLKG